MNRALNIVSEKDDLKTEIKHIQRALHTNSYPAWLTQSTLTNKEQSQAKKHSPEHRTHGPSIGIPYMKGVSEQLVRTYKKHGVNAYHKPKDSLRSFLVRPKEPIDKKKQCGTVYNIQCSNCDSFYIGETARNLTTRVKDHQRTAGTVTAVGEHLRDHQHNIKWENIKIMAKDDHWLSRKLREAIAINQNHPPMNRDQRYTTTFCHVINPDHVTHSFKSLHYSRRSVREGHETVEVIDPKFMCK